MEWTIVQAILMYLVQNPAWSFQVIKGLIWYLRNGGSLIDTDLYKFTMGQMVFHFFKHVGVNYEFTIRKRKEFPPGFDRKLRAKVHRYAMKNKAIPQNQIGWLRLLGLFKEDFLSFLGDPHRPKVVAKHVQITQTGGDIKIRIVGPWYQTIYWEVPLMALISETYYEMMGIRPEGWDWIIRAWWKGLNLKEAMATFIEFGTRRRFSFAVQFLVLLLFIVSGAQKKEGDKGGMIGTSNVFFAWLFGLDAKGSIAHEAYMVIGALYGYDKANVITTAFWKKEYGDKLKIALTDTYGTEAFLKTLTFKFAEDLDGYRQDSGVPTAYVDKVIPRLYELKLRASEILKKIILFSDSLNVQKCIELVQYALNKGIGSMFGIGTFFTNDVDFQGVTVEALNMVIKAVEAYLLDDPDNYRLCVKISDDPGKTSPREDIQEVVGQIQLYQTTRKVTWIKPLLPVPEEFAYLVAA